MNNGYIFGAVIMIAMAVSGAAFISVETTNQESEIISPGPEGYIMMSFGGGGSGNDPAWTIDVIGDENFRILADSVVKLLIDYAGRVGIGIEEPSLDNLLHIGGSMAVDNNLYVDNIVYADVIGIGTNEPSIDNILHVGGNMTVDNNLNVDNTIYAENIVMQSGGILLDNQPINSNFTFTKHLRTSSTSLGKNPSNSPAVDVYGITVVLEFTVDTDLGHYETIVPDDLAGTTALIFFDWTRSTSGSDESGKEVNWQLKYLSVIEGENVHTGEATDNIMDEYLDVDTTGKIIHTTEPITVTGLVPQEMFIIQISAISPPGTALSEPALIELRADYEAYQIHPAD